MTQFQSYKERKIEEMSERRGYIKINGHSPEAMAHDFRRSLRPLPELVVRWHSTQFQRRTGCGGIILQKSWLGLKDASSCAPIYSGDEPWDEPPFFGLFHYALPGLLVPLSPGNIRSNPLCKAARAATGSVKSQSRFRIAAGGKQPSCSAIFCAFQPSTSRVSRRPSTHQSPKAFFTSSLHVVSSAIMVATPCFEYPNSSRSRLAISSGAGSSAGLSGMFPPDNSEHNTLGEPECIIFQRL